MSEISSSKTKTRVIEEEFAMHNRAAHSLIAIFESYRSIERHRGEQIKKLLPALDAIKFVFYKDLTEKLASYFDMCIYQINHMLKDFGDNIGEYSKFRSHTESRLSALTRVYKRAGSEALDSLAEMGEPVIRSGSQPDRSIIERYNYCLNQYQQINGQILGFRRDYQTKMMTEAGDQVTKFFILEMQKLRNNQFDIDQVLKKPATSEPYSPLIMQEQILWEAVETGPLSQTIRTEYTLSKVCEIVRLLWKDKASQPEVTKLFQQGQTDSNIAKLSGFLKDPEYQQMLRVTLSCFKQHRILVKDCVFKDIYRIVKAIVEPAVTGLKCQLLDAVITFSSSIFTQKTISSERDIQLCEVVCLSEYLRQLECCTEAYWSEVYESLLKAGEQQKQALMDRYRRCARRLGLPILDPKAKKKIFSKSPAVIQQQLK